MWSQVEKLGKACPSPKAGGPPPWLASRLLGTLPPQRSPSWLPAAVEWPFASGVTAPGQPWAAGGMGVKKGVVAAPAAADGAPPCDRGFGGVTGSSAAGAAAPAASGGPLSLASAAATAAAVLVASAALSVLAGAEGMKKVGAPPPALLMLLLEGMAGMNILGGPPAAAAGIMPGMGGAAELAPPPAAGVGVPKPGEATYLLLRPPRGLQAWSRWVQHR